MKKTNVCIGCGKLIWQGGERCKACANAKELNPAWKGGLHEEKYGPEWGHELRERIRYRDHFTCQFCGEKQNPYSKNKLDVHHVSYNKLDNRDTNFLALCHKCHIQTNFDRPKWIEKCNAILKSRGIIK